VSDLRAGQPLFDGRERRARTGNGSEIDRRPARHLVDVEDVHTGRVSTYRIASSDRPLYSGEISPRSPLGVAFVPARAVVEFTPPEGGSRRLRVFRFKSGSD
jgi:hypothetical protein